ncbi:MAG TPA: hypothetical protein VGP07_19325 [Polyangia bacterium]|jgi:hypothetical protein
MLGTLIQSVVSVGKQVNQRIGKTKRLHSRALGAAVLAGALLVPVAASAFAGQTGSANTSYSGAATVNVLGTSLFTAPQTVSCMVTVDLTTSTQNVTFTPTGVQVMWPLAKIAGTNQFFGQGVYDSATVLGGYYTAHNTQLFTVNAGQTAQFGCHMSASGTFAGSGVFGNCTTTYVCQ